MDNVLDVQVVVWEVVVLAVLVLVVVLVGVTVAVVVVDVAVVAEAALDVVVAVNLVVVAIVKLDALEFVNLAVLHLVKVVLDHVLRGVLVVVPVTLPVLQTALLLVAPHAQELVLEQLSLHDLAAF